jgi:cytochrome c oxidase subunit IV
VNDPFYTRYGQIWTNFCERIFAGGKLSCLTTALDKLRTRKMSAMTSLLLEPCIKLYMTWNLLFWKNSLSCSVTYFQVLVFMVCSWDISICLICKWVWICPLIYDVMLVASSTYTGCKIILTLKTVDISSRFSPLFNHIYQWVKFEIIILDDSSVIQPV